MANADILLSTATDCLHELAETKGSKSEKHLRSTLLDILKELLEEAKYYHRLPLEVQQIIDDLLEEHKKKGVIQPRIMSAGLSELRNYSKKLSAIYPRLKHNYSR